MATRAAYSAEVRRASSLSVEGLDQELLPLADDPTTPTGGGGGGKGSGRASPRGLGHLGRRCRKVGSVVLSVAIAGPAVPIRTGPELFAGRAIGPGN